MNRPYRAAALAAATVSAAVAVTACGGPADSADSSGGGAGAQAAPKAGAQDINAHPAADLKQGGTLRISIQQWINQSNRNQIDGTQGDASAITDAVEPNLFTFDAKGKPQRDPDFLESAKVVSTSPQIVEYRLNPKAKWSDGKPLGWKDFEAQWKALNGSDERYQVSDTAGYDRISTVEQGERANEVRVTFKTPYSDWQYLFDPLLPASLNADPETFNNGWKGRIPVTGNAWKVAGFDKTAQTITLVPDANWWGDKPKLDKIVWWVLDETAKTDAYLNKEIDKTNAIAPDDYQRLKGEKGSDIRIGSRWDLSTILFNGQRGPLKDVKVRQAVQRGIDRQAIAKVAGKGLPFEPKAIGNHFFMPDQDGYRDNSAAFAFDPAAAKKLLDGAGWQDQGEGKPRTKDGKELSLEYTMPADSNELAVSQAKLVQQMLGRIGVKVELRKVPGNDFYAKYLTPGNFDLLPIRTVDRLFRSSAYQDFRMPQGRNDYGNHGGISSPQIDKLLVQASRTTDEKEQLRLYNQADAQLWELGHSLPLYQRPQIFAVREGLANFGAGGMADDAFDKAGWLK